MKILVARDEEYPSFFLNNDDIGGIELDVPDEQAARWLAARRAWDQAMDEIHAAYEEVGRLLHVWTHRRTGIKEYDE